METRRDWGLPETLVGHIYTWGFCRLNSFSCWPLSDWTNVSRRNRISPPPEHPLTTTAHHRGLPMLLCSHGHGCVPRCCFAWVSVCLFSDPVQDLILGPRGPLPCPWSLFTWAFLTALALTLGYFASTIDVPHLGPSAFSHPSLE